MKLKACWKPARQLTDAACIACARFPPPLSHAGRRAGARSDWSRVWGVVRALGFGCVLICIAIGVPRIFDAARFGDLSYGLYIVHFPIIQILVALGLFVANPLVGLAAAALASVSAAFLLWHLVERPSLRADSAYRVRG